MLRESPCFKKNLCRTLMDLYVLIFIGGTFGVPLPLSPSVTLFLSQTHTHTDAASHLKYKLLKKV